MGPQSSEAQTADSNVISKELTTEPAQQQITKNISNDTLSTNTTKDTNSSTRVNCTRTFSPKFSSGPYYVGSLFDAHFHMPNLIDFSKIEGYGHDFNPVKDPVLGRDVELEKISCNFDKENITEAIGFGMGSDQLLEETLRAANSVKNNSSGRIRLFLMPSLFETETLDEIQENNPDLFEGYGEIAFYFEGVPPPDSEEMMRIYSLAEKHNLIVMAHPAAGQESKIETAIKQNSNVRFLLHGPEAEPYITDLMREYPNVYYSVDAVLTRVPPSPATLMYTVKDKDEFMAKFPQNFDLMLDDAEKSWKAKIEQYPDRFMWGTDRGYKWHYDEDVGALLEEFGRAFIGRLDLEVQEKFAYKNAEKLFEK